jgi:hypothetical protein
MSPPDATQPIPAAPGAWSENALFSVYDGAAELMVSWDGERADGWIEKSLRLTGL